MQTKERTRQEIEARLKSMSDFLKMEYLENCLKKDIDFDAKKFCHLNLVELYEGRSMYLEAARNIARVAEIAVTFKEKINAYMRETELWIKAAQYDRADEAFRKALASGNTREKEEMKSSVKEFYKNQALAYEKANRNGNALTIYEKLLTIAKDEENIDVKKKLLALYKRLGKIREYTLLKSQLE